VTSQVTYKHQASPNYPHVEWLELNADGILFECAVLKTDALGNKLFFRINDLDAIDKHRLVDILRDRNARNMELWDLMSTKTLGNGINSLLYFNQLVRQLTASGRVLDPRSGQVSSGVVNTVVTTAPSAIPA